VRLVPARLLEGFCLLMAELHFQLGRARREVVIENLLPALGGDRAAARRTAHRLYRNFALKLVDLWRMESGRPLRRQVKPEGEVAAIQSAQRQGRGLLFVTLHLGNWELGGLFLAQMGIKLTVLTMAEPEDRLTQLRMASRTRWGIETLVIGQDGFAFVEVIKRLQAGAAVAILLDRPRARNPATVELFGKPLEVSLAAVELARASGCALIGVTTIRQGAGYVAKALPEFIYDQRALGSTEARRALTQQIVRAFEPELRAHLDQWYQFVPVWAERLL
jgi:KDO2-lipid IV(A) lauroyltransferase